MPPRAKKRRSQASVGTGVATSHSNATSWQSQWFATLPNMDSKYADYMSNEWGRAVHSEAGLFEALTLEGAQAGLSWRTILAKREAYRSAFYNFDVDRVAAMGAADIERMLAVPPGRAVQPSDSVVRHRGKLQATVANARAIQQLRTQGGLDNFLWSFVNHSPQFTKARSLADIPTTTATATKMSNQLKALGFKFVGPTTCYSLMQSCGLVVDHPVGTPEHDAIRHEIEEDLFDAAASQNEDNDDQKIVTTRRARKSCRWS